MQPLRGFLSCGLSRQHRTREANSAGRLSSDCSSSIGSVELLWEIVVGTLKEPAITVADGVAAAACAHMRSLVARLRLVNCELQESEHKLDELCSAVGEVDTASGQGLQHRDVVILRVVREV